MPFPALKHIIGGYILKDHREVETFLSSRLSIEDRDIYE